MQVTTVREMRTIRQEVPVSHRFLAVLNGIDLQSISSDGAIFRADQAAEIGPTSPR
jgi:hypothetical protein